MPDSQQDKTFLPLRQFVFFHRAMLISTDTQFSVHTDVKIDAESFSGYMKLNVCIMHKHFPGNTIQETFVWDITRPDRTAWFVPKAKLEKTYGDRYEALVGRKKAQAQQWYIRRVEKIEPNINHLVMQMFIDGCITIDKIEMLIQEKYRPQGGAEMIARLPWDEKDDYQL